MEKEVEQLTQLSASKQELSHLIRWIKENQTDWYCICSPDSFDLTPEYLADLVERLYREQLYTAMYFVLYLNSDAVEMDWAIHQTIHACVLDTDMQLLMERFRNNLLRKTAEMKDKNH